MSVTHTVTCDRCKTDCTQNCNSLRLGKQYHDTITDLCADCYLTYEQIISHFMNRVTFVVNEPSTEFEAKKVELAAELVEFQKAGLGVEDEKTSDSDS